MSAERRVRQAATIMALAVGVIVASCTAAARSTGSSRSTSDELPSMAQNLGDAERAFRGAFDLLVAAGWTPSVGTADFAPCGDGADIAFAPVLAGQLQQIDDRVATEADATLVRDALVAAGWGLDVSDPFVDGIAATDGGWQVGLFDYEFDGLSLRITLSSATAQLDVSVFGECLPTTAQEQEFYDAMGTWYLNVIVPTPTSTA